MLYADRYSEDEKLFIRPFFVNKQKYERGGRMKVKINSLYRGDNSWTVARRQTKFGTMKDRGHSLPVSEF
jgi:hypothetical protein